MRTNRIFAESHRTMGLIIWGFVFAWTFPAVAAESYRVDPVHSSIVFRIRHLNITDVFGRFNNPEGTIEIDDVTPGNSSVEIYVRSKDVDTNNAERDKHIRKPDFLNAGNLPLITFKSETFKKLDMNIYEAIGYLSLHDVSRPMKVKVLRTGAGQDPWGDYRTGFATAFTLKRSDFGMRHALGTVGDEVHVTVNIEGIRK